MNTLLNTLFVIRRLLATAIDGLLVFAFTLGLLAVSAFIAAHTFPAFSVPDGVEAAKWYEGIALSLAPYFLLTMPLVWWLYEATLTKVWDGTTLGKFLLRIRTVSVVGNISFWQSSLRTTLKILSMLLLLSVANPYALVVVLVAFLAIPVFTVKNQFIFDLMASTTVRSRFISTVG
ncbi:RDD family protein [Pseudomonas sp. 460]|uniref:RDD family protein n=1 Tax=Pseudomonas sp. 460 TaxID=2485142 RepID=UPI001043F48E|nr:RDD family protein [Pseudomonas sp. 460]TCV51457.1 RDD family protein [Pseudomonas sp. 460]